MLAQNRNWYRKDPKGIFIVFHAYVSLGDRDVECCGNCSKLVAVDVAILIRIFQCKVIRHKVLKMWVLYVLLFNNNNPVIMKKRTVDSRLVCLGYEFKFNKKFHLCAHPPSCHNQFPWLCIREGQIHVFTYILSFTDAKRFEIDLNFDALPVILMK